MFFLDSLRGQVQRFEDGGPAAKPDGRAVSEFPDGLRRCAESCLFYPAHVGPYPSVSICSSRSMALRTSSRMVSIFSSALFLAFSLGGFSFGGVLSSVGSVDSVLAGAGFDSAGLASVEAGRLRDGGIFSIRACRYRKVSWNLLNRSSFAASSS